MPRRSERPLLISRSAECAVHNPRDLVLRPSLLQVLRPFFLPDSNAKRLLGVNRQSRGATQAREKQHASDNPSHNSPSFTHGNFKAAGSAGKCKGKNWEQESCHPGREEDT